MTCSLNHRDAAAQKLIDYLPTGWPTLKVWRKGDNDPSSVLRFNGHMAPMQESLGESGLINLTFRGPFARLSGDGSSRGRYTDVFASATTKDAGAIGGSLVKLYGGVADASLIGTADANLAGATGALTYRETSYVGLDVGTIETTSTRSPIYQRANVGDAIVTLSAMLDGFDFAERYVDGGATLAYFDVYARKGQDRPDALFQYGPDTLRNVRSVDRETQPPLNSVLLLGAYGMSSLKEDSTSISTYGRWPVVETRSDIYDQASLDAVAQAMVRPAPVKKISFVPELGLSNCPLPWDDWEDSDTVHFYGRDGAFVEDTALRVNGFSVPIDDNGFESAEIPDPLSPDDENAIRATLVGEVV